MVITSTRIPGQPVAGVGVQGEFVGLVVGEGLIGVAVEVVQRPKGGRVEAWGL